MSKFGPVSAGLYYLAIAWFGNAPLDGASNVIFDPGIFSTTGPYPLAGSLAAWDDNVFGREDLPTSYQIQLTGAAFAVPEPGLPLLMGGGLLLLAGLRRRRN